jgi:hypothetical protein
MLAKALGLQQAHPDRSTGDALPAAETASLFLNVIEHASKPALDHVQLIVFAVDEDADVTHAFSLAVAEESRKSNYSRPVRNLISLNTAALLTFDDFHTLDDHMKASGHRAIGERLALLITDLTHD